jgi:tetratricopeptide (TPR) repeat protein
MWHRATSQMPTLRTLLLVFAALFALAPRAHAEDCPRLPEDQGARREIARKWFDTAQQTQSAGEVHVAVKAYQCSFKMVRHAFTAYNMAKLAAKIGDVEIALQAFKDYLDLAPEAEDRKDVEAEISRLQTRIDELNKPAPVAAPTPAPVLPLVDVAAEQAQRDREAADDTRKTWGWIAAGSGIAVVGVGVVLNLVARNKHSDCFGFVVTDPAASKAACDATAPFAYSSYAAFGLGGAALGTGLLMLMWDSDSSVESGQASNGLQFSVAPTPNGGFVSLSGGLF